ncbi:hypothetical protein PN497_23220 [Sphaerospermopsis kisseleviana CS-549]|uniref:Uncharacterized protein n=1 Tax=Sphaerospermopsis kisseleviana CS-549 TaxID=3021783 RepID=A0ABT4ZYX7_9CYAN|nr:hypothetical protein [Sphaerospermopsis kisseleviana CS-549]BAZ79413.1 hypothetical protein NIES73_06560 [Sphaerospermopsis kisseleviana NIES-73]
MFSKANVKTSDSPKSIPQGTIKAEISEIVTCFAQLALGNS